MDGGRDVKAMSSVGFTSPAQFNFRFDFGSLEYIGWFAAYLGFDKRIVQRGTETLSLNQDYFTKVQSVNALFLALVQKLVAHPKNLSRKGHNDIHTIYISIWYCLSAMYSEKRKCEAALEVSCMAIGRHNNA